MSRTIENNLDDTTRRAAPAEKGVLRAFRPGDHEALAGLWNAAFPDYPTSAAALRHADDSRGGHCRSARWIREESGRVVAAAGYDQDLRRYHPRRFRISVVVAPDRRGRGIGARLYDWLETALAPYEPVALHAEVHETQLSVREFLATRGWREAAQVREAALALGAFPIALQARVLRRVQDAGVNIRLLPALARDPALRRRWHALDLSLARDLPAGTTIAGTPGCRSRTPPAQASAVSGELICKCRAITLWQPLRNICAVLSRFGELPKNQGLPSKRRGPKCFRKDAVSESWFPATMPQGTTPSSSDIAASAFSHSTGLEPPLRPFWTTSSTCITPTMFSASRLSTIHRVMAL